MAQLAKDLASDPLPPLSPETILVPGQGIARWVQLQLAQRHGIAASLRLPYPGAFLQQLAGSGHAAEADPFERQVLGWRLFRLLGDGRLAVQFGAAARYCADDKDQHKRLLLAQHLAHCFDNYQLFRQELLERFEAGADLDDLSADAGWQACLWRELLRDAGLSTSAGAARRFAHLTAQLESGRLPGLPPRVSVFGVNTLAPTILKFLVRLAARIPVRMYLQRPTPHWFGDQQKPPPGQAPRAGEGHPLLAANGRVVREFYDLLQEVAPGSGIDDALDSGTPDGEGLLATVQRDLLDMTVRGAGGDAEPLPLAADDVSLMVHSCHSPLRELQVLRDQLLAAIERDPKLQPHDILVLLPDVATYAPCVHAVFEPVARLLPFRLADRSPAQALPLASALLAVLRLAGERLRHTEVLQLLEVEAVQRAFGIAGSDLPALREWIERTHIRWGLDSAHRSGFDVPGFDANSWRQGLDRLLLGHATGPVDDLVLDLLPAADTTAARSELLGRFLDFTQVLFDHLAALTQHRPLPDWADVTERLLTELFAVDSRDEQAESEALRGALSRLRQLAEGARLQQPVSPAVWREALEQQLMGLGERGGFLTGRITFAALQPLRLVPTKVLAIVGMSAERFPRRDREVAFDLLRLGRRPGDPSLRHGDRQLFLDALQSARQQLILSFVGRSQQDDSERAPSVVLAELLDHLDQAFVAPAGSKRVRDRVLVQHPLQPFSARYRNGSDARLFTYGEPVPAATPPGDWLDQPARVPPELLLPTLPLGDLLAFWSNPAQFFCQRVLQLQLLREQDAEDDAEPFALDRLDEYQLLQGAVERALRGKDDGLSAPVLLQSGALPVGASGELVRDQLVGAALGLRREVATQRPQQPPQDGVDIDVQIGPRRLQGRVDGFGQDALVCWRAATIKPKDRLLAWIRYLCVAVMRAQDPGLPDRCIVIGLDGSETLPQVDPVSAALRLGDLIAGYERGLQAPLPMFSQASMAFVARLARAPTPPVRPTPAAIAAGSARLDGIDPETLAAARKQFEGDDYRRGDRQDPYVALCWRDREPFTEPFAESFAAWALCILLPLIEDAAPTPDTAATNAPKPVSKPARTPRKPKAQP